MITLRTLITTVVIAISLSLMTGQAATETDTDSTEANLDTAVVYQTAEVQGKVADTKEEAASMLFQYMLKSKTDRAIADSSSEWVQPRVYPGVELYFSMDGRTMRFVGIIFDGVGKDTEDGERTFGIMFIDGKKNYKLRSILWEGNWFMEKTQGAKAKEDFLK